MKKKNFKRLFGFTLAEVLITLSILGVVAAITVPSLIDRQHEKEFVTKLKKEYAAMQNAYDIAQAEMGTDPASWYADTGKYVYEKIFERMNVTKTCASGDNSCADDSVVYKTLTGQTAFGNATSFNGIGDETKKIYVLKDGAKAVAYNKSTNCTRDDGGGTSYEVKHICDALYMDLNGDKGPNKLGIDTFRFDITQHLISPEGSKDNRGTGTTFSNECSKNSTHNYNGNACAAWAIYKGNMDYKRKTVSW